MILKLPIISKNKIAKDTWEIGFDLKGRDFIFKPGQYIKVILPEVDLNHPKGNLREFSIIPSSKDLKIAFRQSDSDFKQALLAHSIGDLIKIAGPFGNFILPKKHESLVMIAGGMGITPFISMIEYLSTQNISSPALLIYVNSKVETTAYLPWLVGLRNKNTYFKFIHSQNRLTKKNLANHLENFNLEATFLIAGPPEMVRDTQLNLLDLGIKNDQIILEEFTGY